jgi:23S rRNA (cytidine1920-2'-O)/16S rRNA (cytidine1409-2'-O)-methyltransferase
MDAAVLIVAANSGMLQCFMEYYMNRLDKELHVRGLVQSRSKSVELIKKGKISVNGEVCVDSSRKIADDDLLEVSEQLKYVSRGGYKLEHALAFYKIDLQGKTCLDVGASTGGFTDCMLQHGAKRVYAVDVGKAQLDKSLREDKRVESFEQVDMRDFDFPEPVEFSVTDVSFISVKLILPFLPPCESLVLIKPQFELGRKHKGVITDPKTQDGIVADIIEYAKSIGYTNIQVCESSVLGKRGNKEFFMYCTVERNMCR